MPFKVNNLLYIPRLISYCLYEKQLILLSVSHLRKVSIIFTFFFFTLTHAWTGIQGVHRSVQMFQQTEALRCKQD